MDNTLAPTENAFTFTIFIPTYNRAHTLPRTLESIKAQTFRDFEVLVIDDGSTDTTKDLIKEWINMAEFPIAYYWQPNQGKHAAHNTAVEHANGLLMVTLDSDDMLISNALERFKYHWDSIPEADRDQYAGVEGLGAMINSGNISGNRFPRDVFDSNWLEITRIHGVRGDKKNAIRTDLLKKYPYPRIEGEKHIRLSILWERLSHSYKFRYINEIVQIFEVQPDGISSDRFTLRTNNPRGFHYYYREAINVHDKLDGKKQLWRNHVRYVRYGLHSGIAYSQQFREAKHKFFWLLTVTSGTSKWLIDKIRMKVRNR